MAPQTRDHILEAGRDLFTTKGFCNASVDEICGAAGVTPPTLYYHFGSKEGLFEAVVEQTLSLDGFIELLRREVAGQETAPDRLRAYVRAYLTRFPTEFLNPGLYLQDSTEVSGTSLDRMRAAFGGLYRLTKEMLQEGVAVGAFRDVDVETAASWLIGAVDCFLRAEIHLGVSYDMERIERGLFELLMHGLASSATDDLAAAPSR